MINVIDTFKDFKNCFAGNLEIPVQEKINLWKTSYIGNYPELEEKCIRDYEDMGINWREYAEKSVFNRTKDDFNKMIEAHKNILDTLDYINKRAAAMVDICFDINIVIYSGLCNSAGWVDKYNGKRAILYGIDKIAMLNWHTKEKIEPLLAHELCHVIHFELRGEDRLSQNIENNKYNNGIWDLYEEGFAQYFENVLTEKDIDSRGREWTIKCTEKEKELKKEYIKALNNTEIGTKEFFGDWFQVLGISDVGYYLGSKFIGELHKNYDMHAIAELPFEEVQKKAIEYLIV
ncbi:MAG: hypothetical protein K0R09_203 [Clostridiales bacterium]|jgi:hypothetical protein|nr:hypothetical protein [Clostridiales bacterium]